MQQASQTIERKPPTHFRPLRAGPEADLQVVVQDHLNDIVPPAEAPTWTGGSVPLGAGIPDIVRTSYEPELLALSGVDPATISLLAYLRAVGRARPNTIRDRLGTNLGSVERKLAGLQDARIVASCGSSYCLTEKWRSVLPEVISVEVKVSDWRKALYQASRNRIFSHRSYIALPEHVAERVKREPLFNDLGVGLISIMDFENLKLLRRARSSHPRAWTYYFALACLAATELSEESAPISDQH